MEESKEQSKNKRGGRRPGAGRPPSTLKGVLKKLPTPTAALICQEINIHQKLIDLTNSDNEFVALRACCFLWEQAFGKAVQAHKITSIETALGFGDLATPAFQGTQPGAADKPN